jgi:hypothetical protein
MLEKKLQEELNRYNTINKYAKKMIMEQEAPLPPAPEAPMDAMAPEAPLDPATQEVPAQDTMGAEAMGGGDTEEIDITDLVNMTKSLKKDIEDNQNDHSTVISKMDDVFTKLDDLSQKLSQMDDMVSKIEELGSKVEQMKPETPQEKLEMRSLDSYPFNQKPNDFFSQKQEEMRASGKNEYILTKSEVEDYTPETLRDTFNSKAEEDEFRF